MNSQGKRKQQIQAGAWEVFKLFQPHQLMGRGRLIGLWVIEWVGSQSRTGNRGMGGHHHHHRG